MNPIMSLLSALVVSSGLVSSEHMTSTVSRHFDVSSTTQHLSQKAPRLNKQVLTLALKAYLKASAKGEVKNHKLTVIDYSLPSNKERMWVFDVDRERLLYNTYVAHGANSGQDIPHFFSNANSSHATSLGTFVTKDIYSGHNGYSLNLKGLERGINDHALARRVVIHGAWYVDASFIKRAGRAGRSASLARPLINTIKNGSVVFAFYPDKSFLSRSTFLAA
jgi:hypothetical protein